MNKCTKFTNDMNILCIERRERVFLLPIKKRVAQTKYINVILNSKSNQNGLFYRDIQNHIFSIQHHMYSLINDIGKNTETNKREKVQKNCAENKGGKNEN